MKKILYPMGSSSPVIAVTAPSAGLGAQAFIDRFDLIKKQHEDQGITIIEGKCLRDDVDYISAPKKQRAQDLHDLIANPDITLIQPPWGGEMAIDILEFLDYTLIRNNPKWIQGYSDISTLLLAITIMTGVCTVHGTNFMDSVMGQDPLTANARNYLKCRKGDIFIQSSSDQWQKEFVDFKDNISAPFYHTEPTKWIVLYGDQANFSGRLIGGCIDAIKHIIGSPYGDVPKFASEYAEGDGIILYLENCEQSPTELFRSLLSMKYAGWFQHVNGLIMGRNGAKETQGFGYIDSIQSALHDATFPIILDADIGHKPPQMTLLNGALASVTVANGKAKLTQKMA
jgi:muramoyltetrapeptide carboxypeptidase